MAGESVMSQEEIDALIGNAPEPPPPPAAAPPEAAPPPAAPPVAAPVAAAPVAAPPPMPPSVAMPSSIENPIDLSDIYDRLENIEKAVRRVGELDRVVYELEQTIRQGKVDTKKIASQLQQIGAQMKLMMSNLQATPGYGAMKTHKCVECGSTGAAAVPIKCTRCGKTSYKGRGVKGGARPTAAKRRPPGARPASARPASKRPAVARPR